MRALERRHVHFRNEQNQIRLVQDESKHVVELLGSVHDDKIKRLRQHVEYLIDIRGRNAPRVFGVKGFGQNPNARSVLDQRAVEKKRVDSLKIFNQIQDRVRSIDIEKTRHRTEL